ncbi:hypothetical protein [Burkholderia pseudomallei]|uniref:hypothetical protein n=1 Tax=Burkholderia pseudomallei TaxID=28450 RepID=UPI0001736A85|nr:hypothetical protein [Burkholderia pseudomallei]AUG24758.1 hypothetical protein CXQ84_31005 [Burkholderia pseudomallei]EDU12706.1 hypothetical protein BURPS1655_D1637 [Burkholderia pseudomallei 1655]UZU19208.1 hypothetical protein OSB53_19995 [Burkholderia pseudomallei]UZU21626.1 hypothetical protein OSB35_06535 [Burkholderia pseudomallei]UZU27546.1 hypothetical protein OSB54_06540 [Burkholderia pseudomallei]
MPGAPGGAALRRRALGHRGSGRRRARRFGPSRGRRRLAFRHEYIRAPFLDEKQEFTAHLIRRNPAE